MGHLSMNTVMMATNMAVVPGVGMHLLDQVAVDSSGLPNPAHRNSAN
jgi:hypothetical protein